MKLTLHTCGVADAHGRIGHPCGRAADALRNAGHEFEIETVEGYRLMPWTRRGKRGRIRELSGQENVPILVIEGDRVISGSGRIIAWAKANPA